MSSSTIILELVSNVFLFLLIFGMSATGKFFFVAVVLCLLSGNACFCVDLIIISRDPSVVRMFQFYSLFTVIGRCFVCLEIQTSDDADASLLSVPPLYIYCV